MLYQFYYTNKLCCRDWRPRQSVPTQMLLCDRLGPSGTPVPTNEEYDRFRRGGILPLVFVDISNLTREDNILPHKLSTLHSISLRASFHHPFFKNFAKSFPVDKVSIPQNINISSYSPPPESSEKQTSVYRGSTTVMSKCNARNGISAFA